MVVEKLLPQNVEAEVGVLGSILIDPEALDLVMPFLRPEMFYREAHRLIYQAACALREEGTPADFITLTDELARRGDLDEIGGVSFVSSLANRVPTSLNAEQYGKVVERTYILRRLIQAAGQIATVAYNEPDADDALDEAEQLLFNLRTDNERADLQPVARDLRGWLERMETLETARKSGQMLGLDTGIADLNELTGGLQKSDLITLGARPGLGKSALALSIAHAMATKRRYNVAYFSLEMSREQLVNRLVAMDANIDQAAIRGARLTGDEWNRTADAVGRLAQAPVYIDDTPGITLTQMRAKCRRMANQGGLDIVFVDYLQLMRGSAKASGKYDGNRVQEVSELSAGLKLMARELNVPVVALSQLSRAVDGRQDKHPLLSDLRESGSVEQDSDAVWFLYRDDYYTKEASETPNIAELVIAKHRNGPLGTVGLYFQPAQACYRALARRTTADQLNDIGRGQYPRPLVGPATDDDDRDDRDDRDW